MINVTELRLGDYLMQKQNNRIGTVKCGYPHFELIAREGTKDLYPVVLKAELLQACGFTENAKYALLPSAREFIRPVPVTGSHATEIRAYVKSNGECFGRAVIGGLPASNPFYHLHQLQNLYHALTGEELPLELTSTGKG